MILVNPYEAPEPIDECEHVEGCNIQYASRLLRLGGAILDALILGGITIPLVVFFDLYGEFQRNEIPCQEQLLYFSLLGTIVFVLVNGLCIYKRGQTLGKMVFGTVVVTKNLTLVSGNRYIFLRYLPIVLIGLIPCIGDIFACIDLLAIFRPQKNCLHDDIAGTRVILYRDLLRLRSGWTDQKKEEGDGSAL